MGRWRLISILDTTREWTEQRHLPCVATRETNSTNDDAKARAAGESDALVVFVTGHQTAGRGRGANTWLDTGSGEALLSTWSFQVHGAPQAITAPRVGLAVFSAAAATWPSLGWSLKAPNDLYLDGHKVGGLLLETLSQTTSGARLLIGFGLNVVNHPRSFSTATHITGALGRMPDEGEWYQFLDELVDRLRAAVSECTEPQLSTVVRERLKNALNANPNRQVMVSEVSPEGDLHHGGGVIRWTEL